MRRLLFQNNLAQSVMLNGNWTVDSDGVFKFTTAANKCTISHAANTTDGEGFLAVANRMPTPDVAVQAVFSSPSAVLFELGIRGVSATTPDASRAGAYLVGSRGATCLIGTNKTAVADKLYLANRAANNSVTYIASVAQTFGTTSTYLLRLEAVGPTYYGYVNGTKVLSGTSSTHTRPGYVRFGIGSDVANAKGTISKPQVVEGRHQAGFFTFVGYDEQRNDVWFALKGGRQFVYDVQLDEWHERDHDITCLAQFTNACGEVLLLAGLSDGFVVQADNSTQFDAANFTGTWTSNWFDFGDDETRKRIGQMLVEMAKQTTDTTVQLRIESCEHPDLPSERQDVALRTFEPRTFFTPYVMGRFVRLTIIHSGNGNLEIQQFKYEPLAARPVT